MNTTTFDKRTATYKGTKALQMVRQWIVDGKPIRPCYTTGSGQHTKNSDHTRTVHSILFMLNAYPTTEGNDAPRGGLTGQWIKPKHWGRFKPVRDAWAAHDEAMLEEKRAKEKKSNEERAARYADKLHDHHAVLIQWWREREFHPAPPAVLTAKHQSGLTWKEVRTYCRAHA